MTRQWTWRDMPDLSGQTWLITGATSGLGLETAKAARRKGARLVLAVRDVRKGEHLANFLGQSQVIHLDLDSLENVREAANKVGPIDVLINNAGLTTDQKERTLDGYERQWGVNFLGPFLFTNLVLSKVQQRIVILGSMAHQWGKINLDDPNFDQRRWDKRTAYAQSKLADMLWGFELAKRISHLAPSIDVHIAHPGWAVTNLGTPAVSTHLLERAANIIAPIAGQSAKRGALPTLYAATQPLQNGSYIGPDGFGQTKGYPTHCPRTKTAKDPHLAQALWEYASAQVGE